jgi:phosphomannomutase
MVTGSHIPFDRNGIKFNKTSGEVLKEDEPGILTAVARVRKTEYERSPEASMFADDGMFKPTENRSLPSIQESARKAYLNRYLEFFPRRGLAGKKIVYFQHSAVGRDILAELFSLLGADVYPAGRSEEFIAIDTEDVTDERLRSMQSMIDDVTREHGTVDALLSTDGDSDRPLLVGLDENGQAKFFGGDLLGIVVAEYLKADGVAVPVSANDAVDLQLAKRGIAATKTAIGSPYVIKGMQEILVTTKAQRVVGWEANGGFMTGSVIAREGRELAPLPTRDAALPLASALFASIERGASLVDLFSELPPRYSKAGLIDHFPQETGHALVRRFSPEDERIQQIDISEDRVTARLKYGSSEQASRELASQTERICGELGACFDRQHGFSRITGFNVVDGLRIFFSNGDIAHIRPSGNAPQLRLYAVADTQERANDIVRMGIHEPDGLLRRLESTM